MSDINGHFNFKLARNAQELPAKPQTAILESLQGTSKLHRCKHVFLHFLTQDTFFTFLAFFYFYSVFIFFKVGKMACAYYKTTN